MASEDTDRTDRAWAILDRLLESGVLVLGNGTERPASNREIVQVAQFVAARQQARPRSMPAVMDHLLKKTDE